MQSSIKRFGPARGGSSGLAGPRREFIRAAPSTCVAGRDVLRQYEPHDAHPAGALVPMAIRARGALLSELWWVYQVAYGRPSPPAGPERDASGALRARTPWLRVCGWSSSSSSPRWRSTPGSRITTYSRLHDQDSLRHGRRGHVCRRHSQGLPPMPRCWASSRTEATWERRTRSQRRWPATCEQEEARHPKKQGGPERASRHAVTRTGVAAR